MHESGLDAVEPATSFHRKTSRYRGSYINITLFLITALSTTAFGVSVVESFGRRQPIQLEGIFNGYSLLWQHDPFFWRGLYFSIPLLVILLAHEFGHYIASRRSHVDATLPYFLPSPLLLGTFGAFIRIRSPIFSRKQLFDIGISGPVAGFAVLLPVLLYGVSHSKPLPVGAADGAVILGTPLVMRVAELIAFGTTPQHMTWHPFAVAAWAGLLATAINLIPMGQLDGGHILYAVLGDRWHRIVSTALIIVLAGLGFIYWAWWIWAVAAFFLGRRHPLVYDKRPVERGRVVLSVAGLAIFVLSLVVVPVVIR
jgi:membrane-associated protease RseP (regulator of RpoE activity)